MSTSPIKNLAVQDVGDVVGGHLTDILGLFKPGAKITVLVRRPEAPDGSQDFLLSNDELLAVARAIQQRLDPANATDVGEVIA